MFRIELSGFIAATGLGGSPSSVMVPGVVIQVLPAHSLAGHIVFPWASLSQGQWLLN